MKNIKKMPLVGLIIMAVISFSNLAGSNVAGVSVILGVVFFFINKVREKQQYSGSGLDIKAISANIKDKKIWFWILLPLIMDAIYTIIAKLYIPEYIEFEITRAGTFVSFDIGLLSVLQLIFFALGEEIAWRAFFQNQLRKALPIIPVLAISSLLFALGHYKNGTPIVVAFSISTVFINSILYGIVFHKTNNAWISTISHFIANLSGVIFLLYL